MQKYLSSIVSTAESWVWPNLNALIDLTIAPQKLKLLPYIVRVTLQIIFLK